MRHYVKYWYVLLAGALLGLGAAYAYLRFVAVPKYSITSTILVRQEESAPTLAGLTNNAAEALSRPVQNLDNEMQILRSRSLMLRVVEGLQLYASYFRPADAKRKHELYGEALPIALGPGSQLQPRAYGTSVLIYPQADSSFVLQEGGVKVGTYPLRQPVSRPYGLLVLVPTAGFSTQAGAFPEGIRVDFTAPAALADEYNQLLTVASVNKDASILNLMLISKLPEKGRDVLNKLLQEYNREALEDKNEISANKLAFLDERIRTLGAELNGVERNVERFKQSHEIANVSAQTTSYIEQAGHDQRQQSDWATQLAVLGSIEQYLSRPAGQHGQVPSTLGLQDQTLLDLMGKFNNLELERERLLRTTQEGNPLVQNIDEQLGTVRSSMLESLRNIRHGLQIASRNLQASSGVTRARLSDAPVVERELQAKGRQQSLKQDIYVYLLQKREEAALALASTASNSRVIDPATIEEQPVSPNRKMTYLLGLLLGLGLPLSVLYARRQLNDKVETRQEVAELTSTPILGELAHKRGNTVVVRKETRSAQAELFGLVRANLSFATAGRANKVIMVTSSVSGEGKTFLAINLASSLALTGKTVVLLDLDLRRPSLTRELDLPATPGLTDYLVSERLRVADIIQVSSAAPDLFVVSAGSLAPNPAELLVSPKLSELLQELKTQFDYILLDTPPIGLVADAFSIGALADSTIYVVRYQHTLREQVKGIEAIYAAQKFNCLSLVLNDSHTETASYYGYAASPSPAKVSEPVAA